MKSLRFALLAGSAFVAAVTANAPAFASTADSAAVAPQADEASKLAALFAEDDARHRPTMSDTQKNPIWRLGNRK